MQVSKVIIKLVLLFFGGLSIWSCSADSGPLAPQAYANWIQNPTNGLHLVKEMKGLEFSMQYKPLDYIVVMEEKQTALKQAFVESRKSEIGNDTYYFNFRITSKESNSPLDWGTSDEMAYSERLAYCTFGMQQDLKMIEGTDTLACALFQFVRNYDIAPYLDFVIGFERKNTQETTVDKTIIFEDRTFGIGTIKFLLENNSLKNIPLLKTI